MMKINLISSKINTKKSPLLCSFGWHNIEDNHCERCKKVFQEEELKKNIQNKEFFILSVICLACIVFWKLA